MNTLIRTLSSLAGIMAVPFLVISVGFMCLSEWLEDLSLNRFKKHLVAGKTS